ncbi:MAG: hypothetical protein AAFO15_02670, partial [Pseudomonadota bacterium]
MSMIGYLNFIYIQKLKMLSLAIFNIFIILKNNIKHISNYNQYKKYMYFFIFSFIHISSYTQITTDTTRELLYFYSKIHNIKPTHTCTPFYESTPSGLINSLTSLETQNKSKELIVLQAKLPGIEHTCAPKSKFSELQSRLNLFNNNESKITFYYLDQSNLKEFEEDLNMQIENLNIHSIDQTKLEKHQDLIDEYENTNKIYLKLITLELIKPKFDLVFKRKTLAVDQTFKIPDERKIKIHHFQDKICASMSQHMLLTAVNWATTSSSTLLSNQDIYNQTLWGHFSCVYRPDPYLTFSNNQFRKIQNESQIIQGITYPIYMLIYQNISDFINENQSILMTLLKYIQPLLIILLLIKTYLIITEITLGKMSQTQIIPELIKILLIFIIFSTGNNSSVLTSYITPILLKIPIIFSKLFTIENTLCMHENMHIFEIIDCLIIKMLGLESHILFNQIHNESILTLITVG